MSSSSFGWEAFLKPGLLTTTGEMPGDAYIQTFISIALVKTGITNQCAHYSLSFLLLPPSPFSFSFSLLSFPFFSSLSLSSLS